MAKQALSDFETMVAQVLEAKAQKGQVAKASKQFDLEPKQIKKILSAVDPSGRSSYGDWIIKQWMSGDIDLLTDAVTVRQILRAWHETRERAFLSRNDAQLTTKRYPQMEDVVKVVAKYMGRLPPEFQIEELTPEEEVAEPTEPFMAYHLTDFDAAEDLLNRSTWGRRDNKPADHVNLMDDAIHSQREGSWCIRNERHFVSEMDDTQGYILMMKAEPRMLKKGMVSDPEDVIEAYEAGDMPKAPAWVEDEEMREYVRNRYAGGRLAQDNFPYTAIYVLQLHNDETVQLWDLADNSHTDDDALAVMQKYGPVPEQIEAINRAMADSDIHAADRAASFVDDVYISPEAQERMDEWSEFIDGRLIDVEDVLRSGEVGASRRIANLRTMASMFRRVPGVHVSGDPDDPGVSVSIGADDERVWGALTQIHAGEALDSELEQQVARELAVADFMRVYLNPKIPKIFFPQLAANKLYATEDRMEPKPNPEQTVSVIANRWSQLPGTESEEKWMAIFERAMQRLGASWNIDDNGAVTLDGASLNDIIQSITMEDLWFVDNPSGEVHRAQQTQQQQLLGPMRYKDPGVEQWPAAAAVESTHFERLIEKENQADKGKLKKDPEKKKADKRTAGEKDRQSNIYQWFAGLPMRPMPDKADFKRSLEFFGRHAFSNRVKIAEIDKKKKFAKLVSEQTSDVNPDDVEYTRRNLLSRGFRVKPAKPWPGGEYVRMKLFRVGQDLLAPIAPEATQFLPPEAGEHFRHSVPQESCSGSVDQLLERVPAFKGEPRVGNRAGDEYVNSVDLELQYATGEKLGAWIDRLAEHGFPPQKLLRYLSDHFSAGTPVKEVADNIIWFSTDKGPRKESQKSSSKQMVEETDSEELKMGIKVEMEHTDDPAIAKRIALDHLAEFPNYYTALTDMEGQLKQQKDEKPAAPRENQMKTFKDMVEGAGSEDIWNDIPLKNPETGEVIGEIRIPFSLRGRFAVQIGDYTEYFSALEGKKAQARAKELVDLYTQDRLPRVHTKGPRKGLPMEAIEKKPGKLYEFSTPERQSAILWARGVPVKRNSPKTPMWFKENEAYALLDKIAEIDRGTMSAKVLSPKVTSALTGRQIKMVENALRCTQFAVEFVEGW